MSATVGALYQSLADMPAGYDHDEVIAIQTSEDEIRLTTDQGEFIANVRVVTV